MHNKESASRLRRGNGNHVLFTFFLACFLIMVLSICVYAFSWDPQPPIPNYDPPRWEKIKTLWNNHYGGDNLDELISTLNSLKEAYPAKIEPILLLAKAHYLHARYKSQDRKEHFEKAEQYALQACKMDPKNLYALTTLIETLCYSRDHNYIFSTYGALIRSYAPIKDTIEALPDMKYAGWNAFKALWLARLDVEKGKAAVSMVEKMARENPTDGLAQIWASRANYYVGQYYTSTDEHDKSMTYYKHGIAYGTLARKLLPNSVPANYWYMLNQSRSIQFTSLLNKSLYLRNILDPIYFCSKENSLYYFCGPVISLATIVTNGGWITEKGMHFVNITLEMDMNGLEIANILFPHYYYIPYAWADVLAYKGKKAEALAILEKLIASDPNVDPLIPENYCFIRLAKRLYNDIKQGKN
jgi:tetratricopeptide (TPR) repeat protein